MRNTILTLFAIVAIAMATSCSTSTKVTFTGTPGTGIYTPDGETCIGTIGDNGELKTKISDDTYYGLLVSRDPKNDTFIPFALNTKKRGIANDMGIWLGSILTLGGYVGGSLMPDLGGMIAGYALATGGAIWGSVSIVRFAGYDAYAHHYKYLPKQSTNSDISFIRPADLVMTDIPKDNKISTQALRPTATKGPHAQKKNPSLRINRKIGGASQLIGDYVGEGSISHHGETLEVLKNLTVIIKLVENDMVSVTVLEENGDDFFGTPVIYKLSKSQDINSSMLIQADIPSSSVKIDKSGSLVLENPRLEIDDTIYILSIQARKK